MISKREMHRFEEYDYSDLVNCMDIIIHTNGSQSSLDRTKRELNKIFNTKRCIEVLFTKNTDRMFFGMNILPIMGKNGASNIVNSKEAEPIRDYALEIDSKLISPILDFTGAHLTAITLHEIGHIMLNDKVFDEFNSAVHVKLAKDRENLDKEKCLKADGLFKFAAIDTIRKMHSFFYKNVDEIYADKFTEICGFHTYLIDAFDSITNKSFKINSDVKNKLLVLGWALRNYKELEFNRKFIAKRLYDYGNLSGSKLDKRLATNTTKSLDEVSIYAAANDLIEESRKLGFMGKIKKETIKTLENDLYELRLRCRSASDEGDALFALRSLNNRLSIIEEVLEDVDLNDDERDRWIKCQQEYLATREELTAKKISKIKMYGLFTDYSKLPDGYNVYDATMRY